MFMNSLSPSSRWKTAIESTGSQWRWRKANSWAISRNWLRAVWLPQIEDSCTNKTHGYAHRHTHIQNWAIGSKRKPVWSQTTQKCLLQSNLFTIANFSSFIEGIMTKRKMYPHSPLNYVCWKSGELFWFSKGSLQKGEVYWYTKNLRNFPPKFLVNTLEGRGNYLALYFTWMGMVPWGDMGGQKTWCGLGGTGCFCGSYSPAQQQTLATCRLARITLSTASQCSSGPTLSRRKECIYLGKQQKKRQKWVTTTTNMPEKTGQFLFRVNCLTHVAKDPTTSKVVDQGGATFLLGVKKFNGLDVGEVWNMSPTASVVINAYT